MGMNPRTLRPGSTFTPRSISGLALWLDAADSQTLYTTDAGPVTAVSSPLDIAGCALWLDGADSSAASMTLNGSLVEAWKDKSGNSRNFTASGSARPALTAAGQNGRSVVTLDGTDDSLTGPAGFSLTDTHTVLAVVKPDVRKIAGLLSGSVTQANLIYGDGSSSFSGTKFGAFGVGRAVYGGGAITTGSFQVFSAVLSGSTLPTNLSMFTNGVGGVATIETAGTAPGAAMAANLLIGTTQASQFWDGDIAEVIVYPTALTAAQRASVEAYLAAKWGISGVHAQATATNDPVGAWLDKSGNGRHATQGTGAARPTISATTQNSRRTLGFSHSASQHYSLGDLSEAFPSQGEVFVAYGVPGGDLAYNLYVTRLNTSYYQYVTEGFGYPGTFTTTRFNNVQHGSAAAGQHVVSQRVVGGQYLHRKDGAAVYSAAATFNSGNAHFIGGYPGGDALVYLNGNIHEVLAYNTALTDSQRQRIERYLASKWNITLAPKVSNADAQDWINRVYANGGTVSATTASAVNTFCDSITNAGIRDRFYRLNLFCGNSDASLNAVRTPLFRGPSLAGTQYGNATDTNVNFVAGDYAETGASGGLLGNGTSKYLNTGFNVDQLPGAANCHLASYIRGTQDIASARTLIGVLFNGVTDRYRLFLQLAGSSAPNYGIQSELGKVNTVGANNRTNTNGGLILSSRTSTTSLTLYDDAVSVSTNATLTAETTSATPFFVFARNGPTEYYNGLMASYSIGAGMTDAQVTSYYTALNAFQAALGRSV